MPQIVLNAPTLSDALDPAIADRQALAVVTLTKREKQIAGLIAAGWGVPEMAAALDLSEKTITRITSQLVARTGSANKTHLVVRLVRSGKIR